MRNKLPAFAPGEITMYRLKFLARAAYMSALTAAAPPRSTAQPAADPAAQAAAAERQRQQDATPDTPGTGPYAAMKELDSGLPEHVIYRPENLAALGTTKLGVYAFGNGGCTDDGASARLHLLEIASHGTSRSRRAASTTAPAKRRGRFALPSRTPRLRPR